MDDRIIATKSLPPGVVSERHGGLVNQLVTSVALIRRESWVVDIGCGRGSVRQLVVEAGGRYLGIDLPGTSADIVATATRLPIADSVVDLAFCRATLQYVRDADRAVEEIHRILRSGGTVLGSVAFLEPAVWGSGWHLTPAGLATVLRRSGFRIVRIWMGWSVGEALREALTGRDGLDPRIASALEVVCEAVNALPPSRQLDFAGSVNFWGVRS